MFFPLFLKENHMTLISRIVPFTHLFLKVENLPENNVCLQLWASVGSGPMWVEPSSVFLCERRSEGARAGGGVTHLSKK